ncbi:sugar phosphate isomerase/epimerase family protein [Halorhabdus rudnickae]|uniref:sugar phosphate isomerase/epimerase family protein n=1 Tax=Halorhabdus rudnickae TaxID=1775544 RepID=UPI001082D2FB|nr:sugar phosphate isomerase/epimerase [Halorhabdus rudnickae]
MQIGVLTVPLKDESLESTLSYLDSLGVDAVELGTGGHPGQPHIERRAVLDDPDEQAALLDTLEEYDMSISALATHNNPVHPDEETAERADTELRETIRLADQLDVNTVTCFSGLPAGGPNDEVPNWITAPWPTEHAEAEEYQWEVVSEYWAEIGHLAEDHGVDIAIEMHPNMFIYEPTGLLELREATSDRIGANLDPSHLYWQGIDPTEAIRLLGGADAIYHFHAKDTNIYDANVREKGVLDTTTYSDEVNRSWIFRSIGYGHGEEHWKDIVSTLRMVGYDDVMSIEHEDSLTSGREGLEKAVDVLQRVVFTTTPGEVYWE